MSDKPQVTDLDKMSFVREMVANVLSMRKEMLRQISDPRRKIEDECGYPDHYIVNKELYQKMYDREAIATRVVEVLPRETWQVQPEVYEDDDPETDTPFEQEWKNLGRDLRGPNSWHQDEKGNSIWEMLSRADVLSGIGHYGLIFLGIDDGKDFEQPAQDKISDKKTTKLLYMRAFPEALCQITSYEQDIKNRRYGLPNTYNLLFNDPRDNAQGIGLITTLKNVHWSRVVHLADNLGSSEIFGVPRQQPVLNRILDLYKLYGGSAEMYWKGAFPGLALKTQPQLGGEPLMDKQSILDMMENYENGLQRYFALLGMDVQSLAPQVVDPTPQITAAIQAICIRLGIPMRIFMGSERGQAASSQDDESWNERLKARQNNYVTPRVITPFIDTCIRLGILPMPEGYTVYWPDLTSQSVQEKSAAALQYTQAIAQYTGSGAAKLMTPIDFFIRILGWNEKEAQAVADKIVAEDLNNLKNPIKKSDGQNNNNKPKDKQQDNKNK